MVIPWYMCYQTFLCNSTHRVQGVYMLISQHGYLFLWGWGEPYLVLLYYSCAINKISNIKYHNITYTEKKWSHFEQFSASFFADFLFISSYSQKSSLDKTAKKGTILWTWKWLHCGAILVPLFLSVWIRWKMQSNSSRHKKMLYLSAHTETIM